MSSQKIPASRSHDVGALRPIGLAFSAVIAGLAAPGAGAAPEAAEHQAVRAPDAPPQAEAGVFAPFTGDAPAAPFGESGDHD